MIVMARICQYFNWGMFILCVLSRPPRGIKEHRWSFFQVAPHFSFKLISNCIKQVMLFGSW